MVACPRCNLRVINIQSQPTIKVAFRVNDDRRIIRIGVARSIVGIPRAKIAVVVPDTCGRVAATMIAVCIEYGIYRILRTAKASQVCTVSFSAEEHQLCWCSFPTCCSAHRSADIATRRWATTNGKRQKRRCEEKPSDTRELLHGTFFGVNRNRQNGNILQTNGGTNLARRRYSLPLGLWCQ